MARASRLEVHNLLLDIWPLPLFNHGQVETAIEIATACSRESTAVQQHLPEPFKEESC